jgi:NitT/TauT family transport system permease protein
MAVVERSLRRSNVQAEIAGLDALESPVQPREARLRRVWSIVWPKAAAVAIALFLWQCVVWSGWKDEFILPGPRAVFQRLFEDMRTVDYWEAIFITLRRGAWGFFLAIVIGVVVGGLVVTFKPLRSAIGSMITGLQTMPSIAWFPLAIVLFQLTEAAITFVVVLGAAPSIANGLIHGVDHIPPNLLRAGRTMGARGFSKFRHVVLPAAMPSFVGGLKQGWAFAWRSLLAGELIVTIASKVSLGHELDLTRELADYTGMLATMITILAIGIILDSAVFATLDKRIRRKRGLG